ncbi:MAG: TetR/AcrR family transcriptional regulator [Proteobacteria bacterium]|nr:TetR/AcrR family transcriptional regulator [Pseudomonadota bacterium]
MSKPDVATERKEQIVRATVECITRHGYHNFSMQDVAKTAGVSKGIIHYYFLNKDELMMCVLDKVAGDIERILLAQMEASQDPWRKMEIFIEVCFDVVKNTKEYYQVNMDFWTQINQKAEIRTIIAAHYSKFREAAARVLREGMDKGSFRKVGATEYASFMIAVIDGLSLQWLFDDKVFDYNLMAKKANALIMSGLKP